MKIDWRKKLSSRKFWVALGGFASTVGIAAGLPQASTAQISAVISATGVLIAYILGESIIDAGKK